MKKIIKSGYIKIILVLLLMVGVPFGIDLFYANYKQYYETISTPPNLYILDKNGNKVELVLASYTINTFNQNKEEVLIEDYYNYDYKDNNKLISLEKDYYQIFTDTNINLENYEFEVKDLNKNDIEFRGGTVTGNSYSRNTQDELGEFINIFRIYTDDRSFYGTYIYKELVIENNNIYEQKEFNVSLKDKERVQKVIDKIRYTSFLNSYDINNDILTLEYNFQIPEDKLKEIARSLFVCIDDLTKVEIKVNEDANIKVEVRDFETYEYVILPNEIYTFTRDELNEDSLSIDKIKEYLVMQKR